VFPILLVLLALPLVVGGGYLLALGGSAYYVIAGLVLLVCAMLLWQGKRSGAQLYWLLFAGTLAWSFWEVGLDAWALLPRLLLFVVLALWLLTPWSRRNLA
jgi:quinoprotein glucose dehydrogenase